MKKRRSLSSLFLNKPSAQEAVHLKHLQTLSEKNNGRAFVVDDEQLRLMYLTPQCIQSAMQLDAPERLLCAYSRLMMGFILLHPEPERIILIGLGGGSLLKYCYQHFPNAHITAIEINADVIALRDQFHIPPDSQRLKVVHADAADYLSQIKDSVDLIFLDAYDQNGLVASLNTEKFYANCHRLLNTRGVLVANVWGKPSTIAPMLSQLRQQFAQQVCWGKSADSYNLIVFASKTAMSRPHMQQQAEHVQSQHPEIELKEFVRDMHQVDIDADQDDIPALLDDLRQLLVIDPRVPQNYAEWKSHILQAR